MQEKIICEKDKIQQCNEEMFFNNISILWY